MVDIVTSATMTKTEALSQFQPADPGEPVLRHDARRPKDGEDEGDAATDGLLAVEHGPLGHE